MPREQMHYDLLIIGAGPAGLAAACRLRQLNPQLSVCVLEKGAAVGSHILSGAMFETRALDELFPDWQEKSAPIHTAVTTEAWHLFTGKTQSWKLPQWLLPKPLHNQGNYIISLGSLCQWLAEQASALGADIYPGFCASESLYRDDGSLAGVITGDMGRAANGGELSSFVAGIEIHAQYTLLCEGARGHLGKAVIQQYALDAGRDPQHYALGIKEIWRVPKAQHQPGLVLHSLGWPLSESNTCGGGFLYHLDNQEVALGLITDLGYSNPNLNPFDEFQRYKHHPQIAQYLTGGERILYGARSIARGGPQSQPRMYFPGGLLLGDDAGTLNFAKLKGTHTAMKSGMIAAEQVVAALAAGKTQAALHEFESAYQASWAYQELLEQRNIGPAQQRWGWFWGGAYALADLHLGCTSPWTLHNSVPDHVRLTELTQAKPLTYPKPDNCLSFDKLSSVYLSNTHHRENQPCHLELLDANQPIAHNLPRFNEPAQRYCPAGVYEIISAPSNEDSNDEKGGKKLQINAANCLHCKACDIKDPTQNIRWVAPEAGGGPQYSKG